MKEKLNIAIGMILVYGLMTILVALVLLLAILTSSFVAWNTNLFNVDVFVSSFRLSTVLGIIIGSVMMYYDWEGMVKVVKDI